MGIRRPSTYSYPPKFNKLEDAENYSKRLYAELLENDSRGEEITARATDKDLKALIVRPEWYGAKGDGVTDDHVAIESANAVSGNIVFADKTYLVDDNITISAGTTLVFVNGGKLSITSGHVVTINGHVEAGLYQIFSGSGKVTFGAGAVPEVYADDDTVDCSVGINAALEAGPGVQLLGSKGMAGTGAPGSYAFWDPGIGHAGAKYYIENKISVPAWKFLRGMGLNLTTIAANADGITMIEGVAGEGADWWTSPRDIELSGFFLLGDGPGGVAASVGIKMEHGLVGTTWVRKSRDCRFNRLKIWGCTYAGIWLIGAGQGYILDDIDMIYSYGYGLKADCGDNDAISQMVLNKIYLAADGTSALYLEGVADTKITNSFIYAESGIHHVTNMIHLVNCSGISFDDSLFEKIDDTGTEDVLIEVDSTKNNVLTSVNYTDYRFNRCLWIGGNQPVDHVRLDSNDTKIPTKLRFSSCDFYQPGPTNYDINIVHGQDVWLENCWKLNKYQTPELLDIVVNNPTGARIHLATDSVITSSFPVTNKSGSNVPIFDSIRLTELTDGYLPHSAGIVELVTNGGFDSDVAGWTAGGCTLDSIGGGKVGNCLELTRVSGIEQQASQLVSGLVIGAHYVFSVWIKSGTSGDNDEVYLQLFDGSWVFMSYQPGRTTGDWGEFVLSFTATDTSHGIALNKHSAIPGTLLFDSASVQRVPGLADSPISTDGTKTKIENTVSYANDAAAGAAGLTSGEIYTVTGTDPLQMAMKS
jgi:hypothetical protein